MQCASTTFITTSFCHSGLVDEVCNRNLLNITINLDPCLPDRQASFHSGWQKKTHAMRLYYFHSDLFLSFRSCWRSLQPESTKYNYKPGSFIAFRMTKIYFLSSALININITYHLTSIDSGSLMFVMIQIFFRACKCLL